MMNRTEMNEPELNEVIGGRGLWTKMKKAGRNFRAFAQCVGDPIDHLLGTGRYTQDQRNDIHFADVQEFNDDINFHFTNIGEF